MYVSQSVSARAPRPGFMVHVHLTALIDTQFYCSSNPADQDLSGLRVFTDY